VSNRRGNVGERKKKVGDGTKKKKRFQTTRTANARGWRKKFVRGEVYTHRPGWQPCRYRKVWSKGNRKARRVASHGAVPVGKAQKGGRPVAVLCGGGGCLTSGRPRRKREGLKSGREWAQSFQRGSLTRPGGNGRPGTGKVSTGETQGGKLSIGGASPGERSARKGNVGGGGPDGNPRPFLGRKT